jgi:GH15 family glucan-1,4-alpha-glucosidase
MNDHPVKFAGSPIEDYAMIGDCRTAALVGRNGSIDWFCVPRFDSQACFAALLGTAENGRWLIAPKEKAKTRRRYRDGGLVLDTTFTTKHGAVTITDFMPINCEHMSIVRIVTCRKGKVAMNTELTIRFDYGITIPWVSHVDKLTLTAVAGPHMLVLRTPVKLHGKDLRTIGEFELKAGERVAFVLSYAPSFHPVPEAFDVDVALLHTEKFWEDWSSRCMPCGDSHKHVVRSLVTLKALSYQPTGGMVAAVTTSLPEKWAGPRNWDYRYCWLRDATFTLLAFLNAGYRDEADVWQQWLIRAIAGSPDQIQTMYGVGGERRLDEWEVPWLPGYHGAVPCRVGNAAAVQLQLDIYGELADVAAQAVKGGLPPPPRRREVREVMLAHLAKVWRSPDEGIWEIRGPRQQFTHSKVMAWVAFDRASRLEARNKRERALCKRWKRIAGEIHADICKNAVDPDRGCFVQSYGSTQMDASLLLLAIVGFLPPRDKRIRRTVEEIERHLLVDGFVLRYETGSGVDGLPAGEGAFLACSFWLADNYLLLGRRAEAEKLFRRLTKICNDVGLLSEEYDPRTKRMLGNFPQAFSHVALVNTALNLIHAAPTKRRERKKIPVLRNRT